MKKLFVLLVLAMVLLSGCDETTTTSNSSSVLIPANKTNSIPADIDTSKNTDDLLIVNKDSYIATLSAAYQVSDVTTDGFNIEYVNKRWDICVVYVEPKDVYGEYEKVHSRYEFDSTWDGDTLVETYSGANIKITTYAGENYTAVVEDISGDDLIANGLLKLSLK